MILQLLNVFISARFRRCEIQADLSRCKESFHSHKLPAISKGGLKYATASS